MRGSNPNPNHFFPFFLSLPHLLLSHETHTGRKGAPGMEAGRTLRLRRRRQGPARRVRASGQCQSRPRPALVAAPSRAPREAAQPASVGWLRPRQAVAWPRWSGATPAPARVADTVPARSLRPHWRPCVRRWPAGLPRPRVAAPCGAC